MTTIIRLNRRARFGILALFIAASIVSVGVFKAKKEQAKRQPEILSEPKRVNEWLTSIPPVSSKVENLEITNPRIVRQNTAAPGVAFEILNKSARGVVSVNISCGNSSISQDGLERENPTVIIKPYGTLTAEMNGELSPGNPIVLTAAIYEDGKEVGDKFSLDRIKRIRARQGARLKVQREEAVIERSPQK